MIFDQFPFHTPYSWILHVVLVTSSSIYIITLFLSPVLTAPNTTCWCWSWIRPTKHSLWRMLDGEPSRLWLVGWIQFRLQHVGLGAVRTGLYCYLFLPVLVFVALSCIPLTRHWPGGGVKSAPPPDNGVRLRSPVNAGLMICLACKCCRNSALSLVIYSRRIFCDIVRYVRPCIQPSYLILCWKSQVF